MDPSNLRLLQSATAWQEAQDEAVLLDLNRSTYHGLNHAGTLLWSMLAAGTSRQALIDKLCAEYPISPELAAQDVDNFLAQCDQRGYLI